MYLYSISKCLMSVSLRLVMNTCSCGTNAVRDRRLLVLDSEDTISHTHVLQETRHYHTHTSVTRDKTLSHTHLCYKRQDTITHTHTCVTRDKCLLVLDSEDTTTPYTARGRQLPIETMLLMMLLNCRKNRRCCGRSLTSSMSSS